MPKILFLTNVIRRMGMMQQTLEKLQGEGRVGEACACRWLTEGAAWSAEWERDVRAAGLVLGKWMGSALDAPFWQKCLPFLKRRGIPFYIDAAGSREGEVSQKIPPEAIEIIKKYAMFGGTRNYYNLWLYAQKIITGGEEIIAAPHPIHWTGIYHPRAKKVYENLQEYCEEFCVAGRATAGVLFYRDEWVWGDLAYQGALVEALERQNLNVVCVFTNGIPNTELGMPSLPEVAEKFFCRAGVPFIDVLINIMKFSLTGSGALKISDLENWNVPILQAYSIMTPYEEWKQSFEGMNAMEISISVALPEFDAVIHALPIACKKVLPNGDVRYLLIGERVERLALKAAKWARLRRKENAEKKIAIIFHNYPPRNSNIGSAVGLDTIESVRRLLVELRRCGYKVDRVPEDTAAFIKELTANATNDRSMLNEKQLERAQKIPARDYQEFFAAQEAQVREQLAHDWGEPPGEVMEYKQNLIVPGMLDGNIFITVQPPRGFGEDPAKIYHDPFAAPTHQYLAFYQWLRDIWQADAVAHVGTHGNLEWLPGKNAGLSNACYPDVALGDLPNIYPYHMTITGEGIQAKRRGAACLVEHLPAPQTKAGVYDELAELEKLLEEYLHFASTQPENLDRISELLKEKAAAANLQDEVPCDEARPFSEYVAALHNYLSELKNMEVHNGLHILGAPPEGEKLIDYLCLLLRLENGELPSLTQAVCAFYGYTYYELLENSARICEPLHISYGKLLDRVEAQCRETVRVAAENNFAGNSWQRVEALPWVAAASAEQREPLRCVCTYLCERIYPALCLTTQESTNILRALDGEYVEPGPSGSPASGGADLLPTGRNFYGIDPRTLPTPAAWEIGKQLAEQVIERFIAEEGHYPENIGIVLWSGSNMRSHGQCVAEILYLLGIKPRYQSGSLRVSGLEIIPLDELRRPRIDVTARISGLFRDSLPALVDLLDRAVLLAGAQEESADVNFVRKHIVAESADLQAEQGMSAEEAWRAAAYRIFGDQEGCYGAGVAALLEAKNWQSIDDLADVYVRWGGHAYGGGTRGKFLPAQFRKRLGTLDITIKNEDNHETNMLGSDDYNAYHGGMIACVRSIKGSAPRSYCGDSTDRRKISLHSVQEEAKRIFRSEAINPKFIAGMMEHGYKGAADLANMIAHSFQWDATSDVMEDWMYEKYAEKYAFDEKVQAWLREVNPWALQRMTEILLEAEQRGLWHAKAETKAELQELYLSMEGELEERADERAD